MKDVRGKEKIFRQSAGLNIFLLRPDSLSGRNDVKSRKVNFRPDIRQNFKKKSRYQEFLWLLKQF